MASLLALLAAMSNGSADFFGGLASRRGRLGVVVVVAMTQAVGLVCAVLVAGFGGGPSASGLFWGGLAGVAFAAAVLALYQGFTVGRVGLVSPVAAVGSALVPVGWSIARGERPSVVVLLGVTLGLVAISQVASGGSSSAEDSGLRPTAGLGCGLIAGACFGAAFITLAQNDDAGMWPIVSARATAVMFMLALLAGMRAFAPRAGRGARAAGVDRPSWSEIPRVAYASVLACGVLAVLGQAAYLAAVQRGSFTVVVVLASLYPIASVFLARVVEGERLTLRQYVGCALAVVAVGMVTAA